MLNQALAQSGWSGPLVTPANWCKLVQSRLLEIDWEQAVVDVTPFIMDNTLAMMESIDGATTARAMRWLKLFFLP